MRRKFVLDNCMLDVALLAARSPLTESLQSLVRDADYFATVKGMTSKSFLRALKNPVVAATDPWSEVEYQSLYLIDTDPENRIILQEPTVKDPMVGVMVLKAARLRGESGMVYCGTVDQLKAFAAKLSGFEESGDELDEKEFLECLVDAAEKNGLQVIYHHLSEEHGGDSDYE